MSSREITSTDQFRLLLEEGTSLRGARLQGLDLRPVEGLLLGHADLRGLVVLGGIVPELLATHLHRAGAVVFPPDPALPVDPYRPGLYDPHQLYSGLTEHGYEHTPDARAYRWSLDPATGRDVYASTMCAIHDDSVRDALDEALEDRAVVGIMGGHDQLRGSSQFAAAARLGATLARSGRTVLTGGGPGAMEAACLGAAATDEDHLTAALRVLARVPSFRPDVDAWARLAFEVRSAHTSAAHRTRTIGIPTWYYGHEPAQVFCAGIAKFFSNALREDTLLARCDAGIVVLPGAAGTVQEIFQAVTRMYYADPADTLPPLVLVGQTQWTHDVPVWELVSSLATGRAMRARVHLVDTVQEAADILLR